MPHVVISGANRGLGLEFCRQYLAEGWQVTAACRSPERATALRELSGNISILPLDLANQQSRQAFTKRLGEQSIDLLINNAGTYGGAPQGLNDCHELAWQETFLINAIAPVLLTRELADSLQQSDDPKVIFLTSKMGSIADNTSGRGYIYRSSKAALNASIKSLSLDLLDCGISVLALHPGWVRTDMGGPNGLIDVEESVKGMRQRIMQLNESKTGMFVDYSGAKIPW